MRSIGELLRLEQISPRKIRYKGAQETAIANNTVATSARQRRGVSAAYSAFEKWILTRKFQAIARMRGLAVCPS